MVQVILMGVTFLTTQGMVPMVTVTAVGSIPKKAPLMSSVWPPSTDLILYKWFVVIVCICIKHK